MDINEKIKITTEKLNGLKDSGEATHPLNLEKKDYCVSCANFSEAEMQNDKLAEILTALREVKAELNRLSAANERLIAEIKAASPQIATSLESSDELGSILDELGALKDDIKSVLSTTK